MDNSLSHVEILPDQSYLNAPEFNPKPWYQHRTLIFLISFLLSLALGLTYVYSRPEIFRSYASLLTVAQTAIDEESSKADIQHVMIQKQILGGQELLNQTLIRMQEQAKENPETSSKNHLMVADLSIGKLHKILSVNTIPNTNLVELAATGYEPKLLVAAVNTSIDVYLNMRAEEIRQTTGITVDILQEELDGLKDSILTKRGELEEFRRANNITSLGRANMFDNQSMAHFKGLNRSLNKATEEAIKTKSHLDAIHKAISLGNVVVPSEDKRELRILELRLKKLHDELEKFDQKYTRSYLELNPNLNGLPKQIKELEEKIQQKKNEGKSIVLTDAEQNAEAAQQTLIEIKKQLEAHKMEANEFSAKFAKNEALLSDLEGLEKLQRESHERFVQIKAKQAEKYPQVKVITRAYLPREPISPNYIRDALIALVGSLLVGLFCVWLVSFLGRKEQQSPVIAITEERRDYPQATGIDHHYTHTLDHQKQAQLLDSAPSIPASLDQEKTDTIEPLIIQELNDNDLENLLESSDIKSQQVIALLLSGLSLKEITELETSDIDFKQNLIHVSGENERILPLNKGLKSLFNHIDPHLAWEEETISESTLESMLVYAAVDAGMSESHTINSRSISDSYIIYLIKQGIRLSELDQIIGSIAPTELLKYRHFSPESKGISIDEVDKTHPVMNLFYEF